MKSQLTVCRTVIIRVSADYPSTQDQEAAVERDLDSSLDQTLEEIRHLADKQLLSHGRVDVTTY
jgi:hypothetical protein